MNRIYRLPIYRDRMQSYIVDDFGNLVPLTPQLEARTAYSACENAYH